MISRFLAAALFLCLTVNFTPARAAAPDPVATSSLNAKIAEIAERVGGQAGVSLVHLESGRSAAFNGDTPLPLYSVFKLPLAVIVLKEVEAGRLKLNQKVTVGKEDVAPGASFNTERWKQAPMEVSILRLLELSLVESDNTSSDRLLNLVGGPAALTDRLRELGFSGIEIRLSIREIYKHPGHPNTASAGAIVQLLAALQNGTVLKEAERAVLYDLMSRSRTGLKRLRGDLPAETPVLDKTGSGPNGGATNDVGILTLPGGRGHVAVAVLLSKSQLSPEAQEKAIAEIGRAAYDAFAELPQSVTAGSGDKPIPSKRN